jgi:GTP-binding protein YchF
MRVGIIGLPRSGKTTVFNAVAGAQAAVGGFGQPDEIHRATVKVPDPRLDALHEMLQAKKKVAAEIEFFDFPPPARGAKDSENVFPQLLRECDGIVAVINCYDPSLEQTPLERLRSLQGDMMLADFIVADKRKAKLIKEAARGAKADPTELAAVNKAAELLEEGIPLRNVDFPERELGALRGFAFLSLKPFVVVLNTAEGGPADARTITAIEADPQMTAHTAVTSLCGKVEMEVIGLDQNDRAAFLADFGIEEPATAKLIRLTYDLLELFTFFTGAEKESHAWPVKRGSTAPEAAGHIHQDFQRGFIRAEVAPVEDFIRLGGMAPCRKAAIARLEGKEYVVNDGDYILFRFNI